MGSHGSEEVKGVSFFGPERGKMSILPSKSGSTVCLDEETGREVAEAEMGLLAWGLIGRFKGTWPSLRELHKWISE